MQKKTSLKDIAQVVGVSTALVSYVLNNKKENRISKEVAKRIRQVANDLNYQPNQIAKSLKTSRTRTLGLIVADIANPFFATLARYIEDEADKHNYTVIFASSDENPDKCQKLITTLLNRQVDGLILAPPAGVESQVIDLQKKGIPLVLVDRYFPDIRTSYVALNNFQAMYTAVGHLAKAGYRRVGMITLDTDLFHITERTRGYLSALQDNHLTTRRSWLKPIGPSNLPADVARTLQAFTTGPQPIEAVLFASNVIAMAGLKAIKSLSVAVPNELAVICFDETDAYELFDTPLTYIRQPVQELGQLAVSVLLDTLAVPSQITQVNLDGQLIGQASTQPVSILLPD
ncbi:LacI family DNA-binding transcriptional regulator [Spirosoma sp. 209]|uniref:LacI family DNA-binding transcriptional regulator n=1 Tax=Spirosoma sp. 209 TaxID=1955701 RepID=UPI00098D4CF3|nr:substrate-binding domain-containing protein [Spirosoma sp. 209]